MKERDDKLKLDPDTDMEDEDGQELLRSTDVTPVSAAPPSSSKDLVSPLLSSTVPADRLFDTPASSSTAAIPSVLRRRKRQRRVPASDNATSATAASSSTAPSAIEGGPRRSKRLRRD